MQYPLIFLVLFFGAALGLPQVLYGHVLDRFPLRLLSPSKRSFVSPKSPEQVSAELVPGAADPSQFWERNLIEMVPIDGQPQRLRARFSLGGGAFLHRVFTIEVSDHGRHCRYRYADEVSPRNLAQNSGVVDITLTPVKTGVRVTMDERPDARVPRVALARWMDDRVGDELDHLRARQHGRWDWTVTGRLQRLVARLS